MANVIHVDEEALSVLKNALQGAGEDYRNKLARLTALVNQITSGSIVGDPATDLLAKFEAKRDFFNRVQNTINEAEYYLGIKQGNFEGMMSDLKAGMR
jgi:hypothetical protein